MFKKGDQTCFSNYRPISLLPAISKVFERILHDQIYNYFENNSLFFFSQYGYRRKHSTEFATVQLVEYIISKIDQRKDVATVFMDLSKAFGTIDHGTILISYLRIIFSSEALGLLKNYLFNRKQCVQYKDVISDFTDIHTGVPQGSILGPLLFIIYINDLSSASDMFDIISSADDSTSIFSPNVTLHGQHTSSVINCELEKINK